MSNPPLDIDLPLAPVRVRTAPREPPTQPSPLDESKPPTHAALARVLASAPAGQYGLAVGVHDDNRVVGTWSIELHPRDTAGVLICNTKARLQVCASASGDPGANCAFLVISQWPSNVLDAMQRRLLYLRLCQGVLARLDSVAVLLPAAARMPPYVLFLVDGRPRNERHLKALSLPRLQAELLRELEGSAVGSELDLRIAHGQGTGSSPLLPTPAAPADDGLSEAAQVIWPARSALAETKLLPRLRTAAHFGIESVAEAEQRHAAPADWKTASRRGVVPP